MCVYVCVIHFTESKKAKFKKQNKNNEEKKHFIFTSLPGISLKISMQRNGFQKRILMEYIM